MANTAPQTNEPGTFDSDGLPIQGLVIPGQTTMAAVAGSVLVTDPTSADQYTTPHLPTAAVPWVLAGQHIANGAAMPVTFTTSTVAGRTLYLVGFDITGTGATTSSQILLLTIGNVLGPSLMYLAQTTTTPADFSRNGTPWPATGVATAITFNLSVKAGAATANGDYILNAWGFAL